LPREIRVLGERLVHPTRGFGFDFSN
jgi:hypothetical protein